jgi:putative transposase
MSLPGVCVFGEGLRQTPVCVKRIKVSEFFSHFDIMFVVNQTINIMKKKIEFFPGAYCHVVMKANADIVLFKDNQDRMNFLKKMNAFVLPCCEIIAYVILGNHVHLLIKVHSQDVLSKLSLRIHLMNLNLTAADLNIYLNDPESIILNPHAPVHTGNTHDQIQSALRSLKYAYDRYYIRKYGCNGNLWSRKQYVNLLPNPEDILRTIIYIHKNPVFHGLANTVTDWQFSSYQDVVNHNNLYVRSDALLDRFSSQSDFIEAHHTNDEDFGRKPAINSGWLKAQAKS